MRVEDVVSTATLLGEVMNKVGGSFTDDDEQSLVELAAHAAVALEATDEWEQLATARRQIADQAEQGVRLRIQTGGIEVVARHPEHRVDTSLVAQGEAPQRVLVGGHLFP